MTAYDTAALAIPNILRYWALDDTSGTSANESVAAAHGTYINSPTLNVTPGPIMGQAGVQTTLASSHYATLPFSGLTTEVSIFGWVIPFATGTLFYRDGTTATGTGWIMNNTSAFPLLRTNGNDYPTAATDSEFYASHSVSAMMNSVKRFFFVQTSDGTTAKFYIDGELIAVAPGAAASTMVSPMVLGRNSVSGTPYYSGIWAGFGLVSRAITSEEVRTLYQAGRRPQISRAGSAAGVVSSGSTTNTPPQPVNRPGDRIVYFLAAKPDTLSAPSANNGYTVTTATSGGTGSQGAGTGAMTLFIVAKDATVWNEPAPTISWTTNSNVTASQPYIFRPEHGYQWADAITTSATWIGVAADTDTASPLTGTVSALANNPTEGDGLLVIGVGPNTGGSAPSALTVTATGLTTVSDGMANVPFGETTTGNDLMHVSAVHYIMTGTASSTATVSITITGLTNHSGVVALMHLRQTPITGAAWSDTAPEIDVALPGSVSNPPVTGTRLYLPSAGSPSVTPAAFGSVWDDTGGAVTYPMPTTPSNSALVVHGRAQAVTTNAYDVCLARFVSESLPAQTISGHFNLNMGFSESSTSLNAFTQITIRLVDSSGVERSVLYAGTSATNSSATALANELEWTVSSTVPTSRRFVAALTSQTAVAGDRLVVEVGFRNNETSATSFSGYARIGDPTSGSDLAWGADGQATTANRGWIAFQQDLFPVTGTASLELDGTGVQSSVATAALDLSGDAVHSSVGSAALDLSGSASTETSVSGTASLDLSGSGDTQSPVSGSASLSLSAEADLSDERAAEGSADLALSAIGDVTTTAAASALLDLSGAGSTSSPSDSNAALDLTAAGDVQVPTTGTASVDLSLSGGVSLARTGTAALSFSGTGGAGVARSGTASISLFRSAGSAGVGRTGTAQLTLIALPMYVVTGTVTVQGVGQVTLIDETLVFLSEMHLTLEETVIDRAPSSLTVTLTGAQAQTDVTFDIDGIDVLTVSADSDGNFGPTTINLNTTLGTVGVHTLTATQVTTPGTVVTSTDFTVLYAPVEYPTPPVTDAPPVVVPGTIGTIDNTRHWVFQDLLPEIDGGIGSYVFPHNPSKMSSPHYEFAMSNRHTTSHDGKFHVFQAGTTPKEWTFTGYCPTEAHQTAIMSYRHLNRRFWLIDHRNRAWTVMLTDAQFVPRKRHNYDNVDTDWGSDYTITAVVLDQEYQVVT